mgnify:CR=1 FL=1
MKKYGVLGALAWLGRQGTRAIAALAMIGIAVPAIGELLQPVFTLAVIVLLSIAFLRLDIVRLRHALRRPALVIAATAWTLLAIPLLIGGAGLALGLDGTAPALFLGVTLHAVASPMVAAPAFAALMGLDATLVLFALVASTMAIPLTAPLLAQFFIGPAANLSLGSLGLGLFAILGVSALAAAAIRRFASLRAIEGYKDEINGVNVVFLFAFVAVTTRGVQASFRADPARHGCRSETVIAVNLSEKLILIGGTRYAGEMRKSVRTHEPARLIDMMVVSAIVEARSCERFSRLIDVLDDELATFYGSLLKSEARHFKIYLDFAKKFSETAIDDRVQHFLELDRELISTPDPDFRFHSGCPIKTN